MITKYLERKSKHADGGTGRGGFGRKKQGFQNKLVKILLTGTYGKR